MELLPPDDLNAQSPTDESETAPIPDDERGLSPEELDALDLAECNADSLLNEAVALIQLAGSEVLKPEQLERLRQLIGQTEWSAEVFGSEKAREVANLTAQTYARLTQ